MRKIVSKEKGGKRKGEYEGRKKGRGTGKEREERINELRKKERKGLSAQLSSFFK